MSLGGGYQQSQSSSLNESGGPLFTPGSRLRYETSLPVAAAYTGALPDVQAMFQKPSRYSLPELNNLGLYQPQQNAFSEAVKQALGQTSGNFAQRGFLRPENIQAIAGSAAQNVAPQFAGLLSNIYGGVMNTAGQNVGSQLAFDQYQRQQLPFQIQSAEEQIRQQRMNAWRDQLALIPGFLGSSGSGSSSGPGLGYGMTTALFGGIGAGLGKAAGGGGGSDK